STTVVWELGRSSVDRYYFICEREPGALLVEKQGAASGIVEQWSRFLFISRQNTRFLSWILTCANANIILWCPDGFLHNSHLQTSIRALYGRRGCLWCEIVAVPR